MRDRRSKVAAQKALGRFLQTTFTPEDFEGVRAGTPILDGRRPRQPRTSSRRAGSHQRCPTPPRRYWCTAVPALEPPDYAKACDAHKEGIAVRVTGAIEKTGKFWRLMAPAGFELIRP